MSLFQCTKCGCVENTIFTAFYWQREKTPPLCSECEPRIGKWHGEFPKRSAAGMLLGSDGYLYTIEGIESDKASGNFRWREKTQGFKIVGVIEE